MNEEAHAALKERWLELIASFEEEQRVPLLCDRLATLELVTTAERERLHAERKAATHRLLELEGAIEALGTMLSSADRLVAMTRAAEEAGV